MKTEHTKTEHPFHGKGIAKFKCNACGGIYERDLGRKHWTPSYCDKTGKNARLYRISEPSAKTLKCEVCGCDKNVAYAEKGGVGINQSVALCETCYHNG